MSNLENTPQSSALSFFKERLSLIKRDRPRFSITKECLNLRKVSPTLVTLILQGKRKITLDRAEELAQLLKLTTIEKQYFKNLITKELPQEKREKEFLNLEPTKLKARNEVSDSMLKNFINFYVKDAFQIKEVQKNPKLIYKTLAFLADEKKINQSIQFLLKEGYLRKTLDGSIVLDQPLSVKEPVDAHLLVRKFHKKALNLAINGLDLVPPNKRLANTFILPVDDSTHAELMLIIKNFTDQLKQFCEDKALQGDRLHQITINLTPTGETK